MIPLDLPPKLEIPRPAIIRLAEHSLLRPGAFRPVSRTERRAIIADLLRAKRLAPAEASRALLFVPVVGWGVGSSFSLVNTDSGLSTSASSSFVFSNQALGDDAGSSNVRYTLVIIGVSSNGTSNGLNSASIAGLDASIASDGGTLAAVGSTSRMWIVVADTTGQGTIGNVVVQLTGSQTGCGITVFRLMNPSSSQAYDIALDSSDASGQIDVGLNIPAGGIAIGGSQQDNGAVGTWIGLSEIIDTDIDTNEYYSTAIGGLPGTPHNVTFQSNDTSPAQMVGLSASWGP